MYGFKALIFDVDGTVADTERDGHRPAFNAAFAEAGLDWSWDPELYGELLAVTGGKERIRYFIERAGITLDPGLDVDAFVARLHRDKTSHYLAMLREGAIPLRPGVLRLLARGARGRDPPGDRDHDDARECRRAAGERWRAGSAGLVRRYRGG